MLPGAVALRTCSGVRLGLLIVTRVTLCQSLVPLTLRDAVSSCGNEDQRHTHLMGDLGEVGNVRGGGRETAVHFAEVRSLEPRCRGQGVLRPGAGLHP